MLVNARPHPYWPRASIDIRQSPFETVKYWRAILFRSTKVSFAVHSLCLDILHLIMPHLNEAFSSKTYFEKGGIWKLWLSNLWEGRALTFYKTCRKPCCRVPLTSPGLSNWVSLLISSVFLSHVRAKYFHRHLSEAENSALNSWYVKKLIFSLNSKETQEQEDN